MLVARLILGLAYSVAIPLGEAPDEADHLAYTAYIAQEHRLPEGTWMTQAKHPPLYHALAALAAGWAGFDTSFLRANPDIGFTPAASPNFFVHTTLEDWPWHAGPLAMHLARLLSVLAGVGLVAATYTLGRAVWPGRPGIALAAAAFVAFLPESLFIGGAMNNDTLAALLATVGLWLGLRARRPWQAVVTGVVMGLGLWAKVSVAALWPVICLAMVVRRWGEGSLTADGRPTTKDEGRRTADRRLTTVNQQWLLAVIAGLVALAVTVPWFWRNWQLYHDWMGWPLVMATIDRRQGPFGLAELGWLLRGLFLSFWGKFGGAGHIPLPWPFYALWAGLVAAGAAGWLWRASESARRRISETANQRISESANRQAGKSANQQVGKSASGQVGKTASEHEGTRASGHAGNLPSSFFLLPSLITLLGAPLLTLAWLITYSRVALGTDQGRLMFPAIAPLALLLVGGLSALSFQLSVISRQWSPVTRYSSLVTRHSFSSNGGRDSIGLAVWSAFMLVVAMLALVFGLLLPFAPPAPPSAIELAAASAVGQGFGGRLDLIAYRWASAGAGADQRTVTLYWRGAQPIADDLRTSIRLVDGQGALVWEWKRSPGAGRFSTDRWPVGRVVADSYHIPADRLVQAARIEIGVRPFPEGPWLPVDGQPASSFLTISIEERDS